jgi:ATP-dependent helicase YprA (DUF1998 family)
MADAGILHSIMPGLIGYPTMYRHQQQVLQAVKAGQHVLVSTGTGSGKTESFLYHHPHSAHYHRYSGRYTPHAMPD